MRIIFMGTPDFSVPTLDALRKARHEVVAVYSQPPRPAGRGKKDRPSAVHKFAQEQGLEIRTPVSLRKLEARKAFEALDADVAIVVAYGLILGPKVLAAPKYGCFNLHGSLLPRWRGAAPIQRAIMAGDEVSGIEIMRMQAGLDTGPVCMSDKVAIPPDMTAGELHDELMVRGADLMVEALAKLQEGSLSCKEQPIDGITYASKIEKLETRIDWSKSAEQVHNHIRGLSPFPGAWFEIDVKGKSERIKVLCSKPDEQGPETGAAGQLLDDQLLVTCGEGAVRLIKLQRAGKRPMTSADFLRGLPMAAGQNLK